MPTKQPDELDEAILAFLGERHRHKCPSKCGTGCHNCRYTGMEQMPCSICDKDGIAFKRRNEFKQRLVALQGRAVREEWLNGRLDVLQELNKELFFNTTDPSGQFIKDLLVTKIDATSESKQALHRQPKGDTEDE